MPRQNQPRSIGRERALAKRLRYERDRRGLGVDALAKLMTEAGCPIRGTAIRRIEDGDPPRTISVDELFALAEALGTTIDDLLRPMELVEQERAQELIEAIQRCQRNMGTLASDAFNAFSSLLTLAHENSELYEYVINHVGSSDKGQYVLDLAGTNEDDEIATLTLLRMVKANSEHWKQLMKAAGMWSAYKLGRWTAKDDELAQRMLAELRAELNFEEED